MEEKILEILKETFELDDVNKNISQQNCEEWDSMGQLNLVADLEAAFDISIDPEDIGEMKSFTDIVRILTKLGVE